MRSRFRHIAGTLVVLFLSASYIATQTPAVADDATNTVKTGTITGRVVDESGQPLGSATVWINAVGSNERQQMVFSDREGAFKLSGLPPVAYMVSAFYPGYMTPFPRPNSAGPTQYHVGDAVTLVLFKGGVITGKVTTATGDPVMVIGVRAEMIRDSNGRRTSGVSKDAATDDRGIYRIYGLPAGTYIVVTTATQDYSRTGVNAYQSDIPTYAPSSTRETAAEISVRAGEETTDVDIRYRGEQGRTIAGRASGAAREDAGFNVILTPATVGDVPKNTTTYQEPGREFSFNGIADGDYYLTAQAYFEGGAAISESKLIRVRGADVIGIELITRPLASISGRVVLEDSRAAECTDKEPPKFAETTVFAWHKEQEAAKDRPRFVWSMGGGIKADAEGNLTLRNLAPGEYRFMTQFSAKSWYLQSISIASAGAKTPVNAAKTWTTIKQGDRLSGLTVTLAHGAASLRGQVVPGEGATVPDPLFVYLVPAERERADEVLRFYGAPVSAAGEFAFNNLAPGRYWVLPQTPSEGVQSALVKLRLPDASEARSSLRRTAEAAKTEIEFKPCQNVTDFRLKL